MKIGIMQPYFMPYIGYWQLINEVDVFIILDDVNYIKKGWINRNRILINGQEGYFILPIVKASQNKKINELEIFNPQASKEEIWKKIELSYKKSWQYQDISDIIREVILYDDVNISRYIENSIKQMCSLLNIETEILVSSKIAKDNSLKAQERIIDICKTIGGDYYINPIGGKELYDAKSFCSHGIKLNFLRTGQISYNQHEQEFHANLSLIDVLFWNSIEQIQEYLQRFTLEE